MISVLILTYNEERNIGTCIDSVSWSDDVLVFDSFSTDRTCEIAQARGARVIQHRFENYGKQREAARLQGDFKHPWLLVLDADERPDAELVAEIKAIAAAPEQPTTPTAYRVRRKDYFQNRWIKASTLYPSWFVRVVRWQKVHYEPRSVHEYPVTDTPPCELKGHLLHDSFSKGLTEWWAKHVRYADLEAREGFESLKRPLDWAGLAKRDPIQRRRALKDLAARMPFRPFLRFMYGYLWHGGILDGRPGLDYCMMLAAYEFMIVGNLRQLRREFRRTEAATVSAAAAMAKQPQGD